MQRNLHPSPARGANRSRGATRVGAFLQGLQEFGWAVGRNMRIDLRWGGGDAEKTRRYAEARPLRRPRFAPAHIEHHGLDVSHSRREIVGLCAPAVREQGR